MIVIGLSVMQSPMYTVNGNANEVYGKKYTYDLDATASSANSCSFDVVCEWWESEDKKYARN